MTHSPFWEQGTGKDPHVGIMPTCGPWCRCLQDRLVHKTDGGVDGMATPAEIARRTSDPMHRVKTIGLIGGIALLTNNITGPGMIGTPPIHVS